MTDDLERRLRRADPAGTVPGRGSATPSIRELMEAAMQDTTNTTTTPTPTNRRTPRWLPAAVAAAVLVVGGASAAVVLTNRDAPPASAPKPSLTLELPDSTTSSSCMQFSVDILADMPTAFSGTAVETDDRSVVLEVDRWYRGGDAGYVELINNVGPMTSIDGIEFTRGHRYLVTASEARTVNSCGYTAEWSEQMAADFETAFGG